MSDAGGKAVVLQGFDVAAGDIGDQLHLCHPLLRFEGSDTLYLARRFNWADDEHALDVVDPSEADELATLIPEEHRSSVRSGQGVVVAGADFVRAAAVAGIELRSSDTPFKIIHDATCSVCTATQAQFGQLRARLVDEARRTFDEELGSAVRGADRMAERGRVALLVLRRCGPSSGAIP